MALVTLANVSFSHGDRLILDGATLSIDPGRRIGLVGRNGCGKTTLMKVIDGVITPDSGDVQCSRGTRIGYLPQDPQLDSTRTLRREAENAFAELVDMHAQLERVAHDMAEATGDELDRLMKRYERLEHEIHSAGGYAVEHRIDATLHGLGLGDETFDVPVAGLSGGQKARLALARLLLTGPDVLLLDEPTNHLDIAGRQWLERFLLEFPGAVMIISHDRWLLDEVADRIVELARGKLIEYPGNYHAYREQRAVRQLEQQRVYEKQQTHIRHQQQYIQRYKTGQRAKEARGRQKKLERFIRDEAVEQVNEQDVMNLRLPAAPRSGDMVVSADGIGISYDEKALFADFSLVIHRGQRIGVIGPNGCGKSTLVRTLIGRQTPDQGHVRTGTNLSIGYYHQTHEHLDDSDTPVSYLKRCVPNNAEQSARDLAGAFLFSGIDQDKTFGVLSGGERTRAVLAGLMVGAHNLLVLDEPSNHLDIPSAERLEQSLRQYDGTLILITHDRMLLQDTVDELLVFEHHRVRHFLGSYREWLAAHRENQQVRGEAVRPAAQRAKTRAAPQRPVKDDAARAASQAASRKPQAAPRKSKLWYLSETELEAQIADLESRLAELDKQLADPELYRDKAAFTKVHEDRKILADQLEPLETEWLKRAEDA